MRDQQAIALNGNRYATFVQMDQAQVDKIRADPRISYAGVSVSVGTVELNRILTLGLNEYWGDSLSAYPSLSQVEEGRAAGAAHGDCLTGRCSPDAWLFR